MKYERGDEALSCFGKGLALLGEVPTLFQTIGIITSTLGVALVMQSPRRAMQKKQKRE